MLVLLSPAKNLDCDEQPPIGEPGNPALLNDSLSLIDQLKRLDKKDLKRLMKISDALAQLNYNRYQQFETPFTLENAKQAIYMFQGDVYKGLDAETLDEQSVEFANKHIRILSGLYGVVKPLDLIQPYRLEMGTRLETERGKDLYSFWGDRITNMLNEDPAGNTIVNLASNEYARAVNLNKVRGQWLDITFKQKKGEHYKVIGIHAKKARGLMARYIATNLVDQPDKLTAFKDEGYQFRDDLSSEREFVFTRD